MNKATQNSDGTAVAQLLQEGVELFDAGYVEEASNTFANILKIDPYFAIAYCYLSIISSHQYRAQEGFEYARKGLIIDPEDPYLHYALGLALEKLGELPEALQALQQYSAAYPHDTDCLFLLGTIYEKIEEPKHALELYKKVITISPDHPQARLRKATLDTALGNGQEAINELEELVNRHPKHAEGWLWYGKIATAIGDYETAYTAYREALQLRACALEHLYEFSFSCLHTKRYTEGAIMLEELSKKLPNEMGVWLLLGEACIGDQQYTKAVNAFKHVVQHDIEHIQGHYGLGIAYKHMGDEQRLERQIQFLTIHNPSLAEKLKG